MNYDANSTFISGRKITLPELDGLEDSIEVDLFLFSSMLALSIFDTCLILGVDMGDVTGVPLVRKGRGIKVSEASGLLAGRIS